ncbi:hypothetical protein ACFL35_11280 [Candidatus Riflebacteria bacterium]
MNCAVCKKTFPGKSPFLSFYICPACYDNEKYQYKFTIKNESMQVLVKPRNTSQS